MFLINSIMSRNPRIDNRRSLHIISLLENLLNIYYYSNIEYGKGELLNENINERTLCTSFAH